MLMNSRMEAIHRESCGERPGESMPLQVCQLQELAVYRVLWELQNMNAIPLFANQLNL